MLKIVTATLLGLRDFGRWERSHPCLQLTARFEPDHATIRDTDLAVRLVRIAANFSFGDAHLEGAKGAEGDVVTLFQSFTHHLDECVHEGGHFRLGEADLISEIRHNFAFRDGSHGSGGGNEEMPSYKDYASIN